MADSDVQFSHDVETPQPCPSCGRATTKTWVYTPDPSRPATIACDWYHAVLVYISDMTDELGQGDIRKPKRWDPK